MMKRAFSILLVALVFVSCKSETTPTLPPNTYEVNVTAKGIYNGLRAHLNIKNNRNQEVAIDTAMFVNEMATFTGNVKSPAIRLLTINGVKGNLQLVLEPGVTNIEVYKDSIHLSKIEGGPNNQAQNQYKTQYKAQSDALVKLRRELNKARRTSDTVNYGILYQESLKKSKELNAFAYDFIEKNPDNEFSLLLLETTLVGNNQDVEKIKNNFASLTEVINKNPGNALIGKKIETFIAQKEAVKNVDIGRIAPDFSAPTPDGELLALNDIKGKATIIDFWASWCGPCRRENPNVVKVYEKYHDKGLEIISVSLDRPNQKNRWLQAIEKDNLDWHHVSNLQFWNDPVARKYSVKSIPAMFVLDAEGRIVAKKLRGKALEEQIASMLN